MQRRLKIVSLLKRVLKEISNKHLSFQYIAPTEEQKALMQEFRDKFEVLAKEISEKVTDSRGKSLCITKLEEAAFWLNKGITNNL